MSEGLADIFQVMYNLLDAIRDMPEEVVLSALVAVKDDFEAYHWSHCTLQRVARSQSYTLYFHHCRRVIIARLSSGPAQRATNSGKIRKKSLPVGLSPLIRTE